MNKGFRHLWLPGCVAALLMTSGWANGAVFTMEVVDVTGSVPANPVDVTVIVGDTLVVEFYLAGWSPDLLKGYQCTLAESGFSSVGGAPLELTSHTCTRWCSESGDPCDTDDECPGNEKCVNDCFGGSHVSLCLDGICAGDGLRCDHPGGSCLDSSECLEDPEGDFCDCYASVYIDKDDPDIVFPLINGPNLYTNCRSPGALLGGYSWLGAAAVPETDPGHVTYVGTLLVTIPMAACGVYTLSYNPDPAYTMAADPNGAPILPLDTSATIVIRAPDCDLEIGSSDRPNCAIDARQPHALNDSSDKAGWESIAITFTGDASGLGVSDFSVWDGSLSPPEIVPPLGHPDPETVVLNLDRKISTRKWTCFTYLGDPPGQEVCIGYLPGDVNGENDALADDISVLINHLNGGVTRPLYSVDIDRDGEVGPADILRLMDLLNGAEDFTPWLGKFIGQVVPESCPTAP